MTAPAQPLTPGRVAIVGPGRAGTVLAAALERAGHRIAVSLGGGEPTRQRFSSRFPDATVTPDPGPVRDADLVVLAVPDDAVERVATDLTVADVLGEGQRVVHIAGSLGLAALRRPALAGARTAACHPAQTIHAPDLDPDVLAGAAWAVTARADDRPWARALVEQVGGVPHDVPEGRRTLYHAGLTVGSNAVGAAVSLARRLLLAATVEDPAAFLGPLVEASVANVLVDGASAITGPVVRGDLGTVRRHLDELDRSAPELADAYRDLLRATLAQVQPSLDRQTASALGSLLGGER